ncbi:hypothetical protein [Pseudonocardia sp. T1-2H]|uniref:hypothetical protein n=1 Tax=Pseudonocardia sp. T1-2H TaxID=3128899 RepID=UPI0031017564
MQLDDAVAEVLVAEVGLAGPGDGGAGEVLERGEAVAELGVGAGVDGDGPADAPVVGVFAGADEAGLVARGKYPARCLPVSWAIDDWSGVWAVGSGWSSWMPMVRLRGGVTGSACRKP